MRHLFIVFLCFFFFPHRGFSQYTFPYELTGKTDYPLLATGILTTGVSIYLDKRVKPLSEAQIAALQVDKLWQIDRYATRHYSHTAHQLSNVTGITSILFPFALLLDKNTREHSGKLVLITMEGALINAGLTSLAKATVHRTRPFVYNGSAPLELKLKQEARYSFYSGHTAVSSFFTFCGAQMYNDIYPDSSSKGLVWTSAAVLPLMTGFGRMRAGKHFFTDVIVGYGVGAALGILVPRLHRI